MAEPRRERDANTSRRRHYSASSDQEGERSKVRDATDSRQKDGRGSGRKASSVVLSVLDSVG